MAHSMVQENAMTNENNVDRARIRRHALWLAAAALGVFVTYIGYVYVYILSH